MPLSLSHPDRFVRRHVGPDEADVAEMLRALECPSLEALVDQAVPRQIRMDGALKLPRTIKLSDGGELTLRLLARADRERFLKFTGELTGHDLLFLQPVCNFALRS